MRLEIDGHKSFRKLEGVQRVRDGLPLPVQRLRVVRYIVEVVYEFLNQASVESISYMRQMLTRGSCEGSSPKRPRRDAQRRPRQHQVGRYLLARAASPGKGTDSSPRLRCICHTRCYCTSSASVHYMTARTGFCRNSSPSPARDSMACSVASSPKTIYIAASCWRTSEQTVYPRRFMTNGTNTFLRLQLGILVSVGDSSGTAYE